MIDSAVRVNRTTINSVTTVYLQIEASHGNFRAMYHSSRSTG